MTQIEQIKKDSKKNIRVQIIFYSKVQKSLLTPSLSFVIHLYSLIF
jgi:hypothetical protein